MPATKSGGRKSLKRELTLFTMVMLGVGSIIGSGVFVIPAIMGGVAGPAFVVSVLFVGIIVMILGLAYAELGSAYPMTGGPYSLPRKALGNSSGFALGFGYFIYAFTGTAAIIDVFITYLGYYVPGLVSSSSVLTPLGIGIALLAIAFFTVINILGVRLGAEYSIVTTLGKVIPLALFAIVGIIMLNPGNFHPFTPFGFAGIELAMALDFFAFTGFESVVIPEGEVKDPKRNIPRAMILTVLVVIAIYALVSVAFTGIFNWANAGIATGDWASVGGLASPFAIAAAAAGLPLLALIIVIGAIISTAGAGGDWVLLQARIPFAMAKNKLFWSSMGDVNSKYRTPVKALIFASVLTGITMVLLPTFPSVALLASITTLVPYACAALALPILRKTDPKAKRPFRLPFGTLFALAGFVLSTLLIYWASWPWTLVGCVLMLAAYPLYVFVKGKRSMELGRNAWLIVYLLGIVAISLLGDPTFTYNNFLPIGPMGILTSPYDTIAIVAFSLVIFAWAYLTNIRHEPMKDDLANE